MDFINGLVEKVKPQLNHIYTEKPYIAQGGGDLGWFCREHALHLYGLAILLSKKAYICNGDYILYHPKTISFSPNIDTFGSLGCVADHSWCCIDDNVPVDVSITVKHVYPEIHDVALICKEHSDLCTPFRLHYSDNQPDDVFLELSKTNEPFIGFNEKQRLQFDIKELLNNPFQFLHRPPPGYPTFPQIHGDDVFYAITWYCYRLLTEDINPCFRPNDAVERIMKNNPNARQEIEVRVANL